MPSSSPRPLLLTLCCSPADRPFRDALRRHLEPLQAAGTIAIRELTATGLASVATFGAIAPIVELGKLAASDIFVPLLSANFLADASCRRLLRASLERARDDRLRCFPTLARPVDLGSTSLHGATLLPRSDRALSLAPDLDKALAALVRELRTRIDPAPKRVPRTAAVATKRRRSDAPPRKRKQAGARPPRRRPSNATTQHGARKTDRALRVLCVFADPTDLGARGLGRLDLGREHAEIRRILSRHDSIEANFCPSATLAELHSALLEGDYDIVHVSGHHELDLGFMLADERGRSHAIDLASLIDFIATRPSVECLVLNTCDSCSVIERCPSLPYIIAMDGAISDDEAIVFSRHFYRALAHGLDIPCAFEDCSCLMRCDSSQSQPRLYCD